MLEMKKSTELISSHRNAFVQRVVSKLNQVDKYFMREERKKEFGPPASPEDLLSQIFRSMATPLCNSNSHRLSGSIISFLILTHLISKTAHRDK